MTMRFRFGHWMKTLWRQALLLCGLTLGCGMPSWALTSQQAALLASGETDARIAALQQALSQADEATARYLKALSDDAVKYNATHVWVMRNGQGVDPVSDQVLPVADDAQDVINNNRMRGELDAALAALQLFNSDAKARMHAVLALLKEPDVTKLPLLEKALQAETDASVKAQMLLARAAVWLGSDDASQRLQAAKI